MNKFSENPDPPISSISWGKKFSLKDRTPQFCVILFLALLMVIFFAFFCVIKYCDEDSNSNQKEIKQSSKWIS